VTELARQMARTDERRAASMFHPETPLDPVPVLTPLELAARRGPRPANLSLCLSQPAGRASVTPPPRLTSLAD
jgi:hypothetical protein